MGVLEVKIDLALSKHHHNHELIENPESNLPPKKIHYEKGTAESISSRNHAEKLYAEAKSLQTKFLNALKNGETVEVAPLELMADDLIDSIFKNSDALIYLSKIRDKDTYLMEHSLNVGMLLANFGRYLHLPKQMIKELLVGGLLHDTGKIMIPDEILHKPGKLTVDEFEIMKKHVEYSIPLLKQAEGLTAIMRMVAETHHERFDGQGYPRKHKADTMHLIAKMSSIVDVFDALTADRCYKKGMVATQAFRILLQGIGSQFDGDLVNKFIKCMGIYPAGTLVKLKSGKLALVIKNKETMPLQPVVKIIYSLVGDYYLEAKLVDLTKTPTEEIENAVDPKSYHIDISRFY